MTSLQITDEAELAGVVETVLETLASVPTDRAQVVALHGDLGAGKTTFVQYLARQLGVVEVITSPTFVIMKGYPTTEDRYRTLVHIDAYRVDGVSEMEPLKFPDVLAQPNTLVCIEWAERIESLLPAHTLHVRFTHLDQTRVITVTYGDEN